MSLIVKGSSGVSAQPIEAGTHPAVCYGLVDIGHQYNEKYEKSTHKLVLMFEIMDAQITTKEGVTVNRSMSNTYTASLNDKSKLYKDLIAWRGKPFTEEELKGFNLKNVVGAPCFLSVIHSEKNGNTYANIQSIMKMPASMVGGIVPTLDKVIFDLDESDMSMMDSLPEWIQNKIKDSDEYKERMAGQGHAADDSAYTEGGLSGGVFTELANEEELPF